MGEASRALWEMAKDRCPEEYQAPQTSVRIFTLIGLGSSCCSYSCRQQVTVSGAPEHRNTKRRRRLLAFDVVAGFNWGHDREVNFLLTLSTCHNTKLTKQQRDQNDSQRTCIRCEIKYKTQTQNRKSGSNSTAMRAIRWVGEEGWLSGVGKNHRGLVFFQKMPKSKRGNECQTDHLLKRSVRGGLMF